MKKDRNHENQSLVRYGSSCPQSCCRSRGIRSVSKYRVTLVSLIKIDLSLCHSVHFDRAFYEGQKKIFCSFIDSVGQESQVWFKVVIDAVRWSGGPDFNEQR
jgi:hypothetical protein